MILYFDDEDLDREFSDDEFVTDFDYSPDSDEVPILDRVKALYGLFQENAVNSPGTMIAKGANAMMDLLDKFISEAEGK